LPAMGLAQLLLEMAGPDPAVKAVVVHRSASL